MSKHDNLYDKLCGYAKSGALPLHMPGHKRNTELLGTDFPYEIDITEIDGFDNLHRPEGIILNIMKKAQRLYKSGASFPLINGSTCGILAAVRCAVSFGDEIIIARNCHKAVYNACELNNLNVSYIYPQNDSFFGLSCSVSPQSVSEALKKHPKAKAVVLTSPTYEGVISDIGSIADITHFYGIPLIVDNAHGAHQPFIFSEGEPVQCGADIVISSLHKTLPSLTQTAVAHINGDIIKPEDFSKQLAVFETSSPSYILMASIDRCLDILSSYGSTLFSRYKERLDIFSEKAKRLNNLKVLCCGNDNLSKHNFFSFDYGKIVICTNSCGISGTQLSDILRKDYNIETEMSYTTYALAMTSVCDTDSTFDRLFNALADIDGKITPTKPIVQPPMPIPQKSKYSFINLPKEGVLTSLDRAEGEISLDYIFAYPPGIPILTAGEIIDKKLIQYVRHLNSCGTSVQSTAVKASSDDISVNVVKLNQIK